MSSGLISCFLCLMRNSSGPFPRLTFAHFSTGSSIQPLSTCCKAASPPHLINSRGLLILAHGAEATSSSLTSVPSLEPLPPPPQKKIPLAVQWSLSAVRVPSGQGSTSYVLQLQAFAMVMGPQSRALLSIHGVHCVRGQTWESQRRVRSGNEGGLAVFWAL